MPGVKNWIALACIIQCIVLRYTYYSLSYHISIFGTIQSQYLIFAQMLINNRLEQSRRSRHSVSMIVSLQALYWENRMKLISTARIAQFVYKPQWVILPCQNRCKIRLIASYVLVKKSSTITEEDLDSSEASTMWHTYWDQLSMQSHFLDNKQNMANLVLVRHPLQLYARLYVKVWISCMANVLIWMDAYQKIGLLILFQGREVCAIVLMRSAMIFAPLVVIFEIGATSKSMLYCICQLFLIANLKT